MNIFTQYCVISNILDSGDLKRNILNISQHLYFDTTVINVTKTKWKLFIGERYLSVYWKRSNKVENGERRRLYYSQTAIRSIPSAQA